MTEELQPRALYNLLRMNQDLDVEPWKVADYRAMDSEEILETLGLGAERFTELAEQVASPEELTGFFVPDEASPEEEDRLYLLVFELWRRLFPERQSLSIFCDELDHQMAAYDEGEGDVDDLLCELQEILDDSVDEGGEAKEIFADISTYFANDLESFLYDYMAEQIDNENGSYAQELLEMFSPYVEDERYFQLLQVRLWARDDLEHAESGLEVILEEEHELDLNLEILDFLAHSGDRELFLGLAKETLSLLETEEEFLELLDLCIHYYRCLDFDEKEMAIDRLIHTRKDREPSAPFSNKDPDVQSLISIMTLGANSR